MPSIFETVRGFITERVDSIPANMFNEWFDTDTAQGVPGEAATTIAAIRAAVAGGYTLQTFTASNAAWTVPPELANATEAWAGAIGGSGKSTAGGTLQTNTVGLSAFGGIGAKSGGYMVERVDPSTLAAVLAIVIGAGATVAGTDGGITSISTGGTPLVTSVPGASGIGTPQGYQLSSSMPGNGGAGGNSVTQTSGTAGEDGDSSATAAGGNGGAASTGTGNRTGTSGTAGAAGQSSDTPVCGGGGGAGGGAATCTENFRTAVGGNGGNGGYPGGAPGAGGAATSMAGGGTAATGGVSGTPTNGFGFLLWR